MSQAKNKGECIRQWNAVQTRRDVRGAIACRLLNRARNPNSSNPTSRVSEATGCAATHLVRGLQHFASQHRRCGLQIQLRRFLANFLHRAPTSLLTCSCANHHPDSATKPTLCVGTARRVNESALVTIQFSNSNPVPPKYNLPPTQRPHRTRQAHRRRPRRPPTTARVRYPRVTRLLRLLGTRLPHLLRAESISRPTSTP